MIYILVALALFGILTAVLANQSAQTDSENMEDEMAEFKTTQILAFAQSAQAAINQMLMSGSDPADLDFALPNAATYDTAPYVHKVFHPDGGGLILKDANTDIFTGGGADPVPGWYMGRFNNVQWTPTAANDIVLAAYNISRPICESINTKVNGSATIPAIASGTLRDFFVNTTLHGGGANAAFTTAVCGACNGRVNMCVSDTTGTTFAYYLIIEGL